MIHRQKIFAALLIALSGCTSPRAGLKDDLPAGEVNALVTLPTVLIYEQASREVYDSRREEWVTTASPVNGIEIEAVSDRVNVGWIDTSSQSFERKAFFHVTQAPHEVSLKPGDKIEVSTFKNGVGSFFRLEQSFRLIFDKSGNFYGIKNASGEYFGQVP